MKRLLLIFAVAAILLCATAVPALAAGDSSGTVIQVLVPDTSTPVAPKLYPTDVTETYTPNGSRMIVKTYQICADDDPGDIPRDSFEREGWRYTLTDITHDGNTYTASFIGAAISDAPSAAAQLAPLNSMPLTLIAAAAALLAGLSLGYFIFHKNRRKS